MFNRTVTFIKKYKSTVIKEMIGDNLNIVIVRENGDEISYKFKDPRDALNFLVRNWKLMETVDIETLFEYVQYGSNLGTFKHIDFYYLLMLEVIITFLVNNYNKDYSRLDRVIRESHLYAVGNTHKIFNQKNHTNFCFY